MYGNSDAAAGHQVLCELKLARVCLCMNKSETIARCVQGLVL